MIAIFIISVAFIPIIGVMGTTIKGTQKDEKMLRAVQLAQTTLNTALQIPFNSLVSERGGGGDGPWTFGQGASPFVYATQSIELRLGSVPIGGITYSLVLHIRDENPQFTLQTHNPMLRANASETPGLWGWVNTVQPTQLSARRGLFHRYQLSVTWQDPSFPGERSYRLVSYKARLQE